MKEIAGKEWEDRLDSFANAEPVGGDKFVCGGLFFNGVENYLSGMAKIIKKVVKKDKDAYEEFEKFLRDKSYKPKGDALYSKELLIRWQKPFKLVKRDKFVSFYRFLKDKKFDVYSMTPANPSDVEKYSGLVFLRIKGYEDAELSRELKWELRKKLLQEWKRLSEDLLVRQYLDSVEEFTRVVEDALPDAYSTRPLSRLFFYLLPVEFDKFLNAVVISRVSLYRREEKTKQELWEKILKEMEEEKLREDLEYYMNKKNKELKELEELLRTALEEDTLKKLMEDWKAFIRMVLKGESSFIVGAFLKREGERRETWMSFGEYQLPQRNIRLSLFYEEGTEDLLETVKRELESLLYMGNIKVTFDEKAYPINKLFGNKSFFELLKGTDINGRELKNMESVQLLYALIYFTARLWGFQRISQKSEDALQGILLLLNTELEEKERYAFWEYVSFLYDYYGLPVQTITRRFVENLKNPKGKEATKKNMLISLYKDTKTLKFSFEGFNLPQRVTVYAIVEEPSGKFLYTRGDSSQDQGVRNYLYEVYRIRVEGKTASVEVEDKFLVLSEGYGEDAQWLREFIRERMGGRDVRFCFISPLERSFLSNLYDELSKDSNFRETALHVRYKELKTAYLSKGSENHCLVMYTPQFRTLMDKLGVPLKEDAAVIALKPARPQREEKLYHPALQVFFTEKVGWMSEEVYSERKNLFLFTLIALSMYESESATVPYSKLNLISKERSSYLRIKRKDESLTEREYLFSLKPLLYEMLDFMRHVPGNDKME